MRRPTGQTIANYFAEHFNFLEELFSYSKESNFFISTEVLENRCEAYEKTGKAISLKKLEEYKIISPLSDENYEINKRFSDFIAFLINDFRLDLPESIKKYQHVIEEIYSEITLDNLTLNSQKTVNQIIDLSKGLIREMQEFDLQIESNTAQLFIETTYISANKDEIDYTDRIQKATDLIENYIKPLNNILSKEYTNSFNNLLRRIGYFANLQRHEQQDTGLQIQFEIIYQKVVDIIQQIFKNSSIMARDITPLLNRLRTESQIMKGIDLFLLDAKRGIFEDSVSLFDLKSKRIRSPYAKSFELSAKSVFEIVKKQEIIDIVIEPETEVKNRWIFDKKVYKQKLLNDLPIENFFNWCYHALKNEIEEDITVEKFNYLSSLLFEKEVEAEFLETEKFKINLKDSILTVPFVKLISIENDR